MKKRGIKGKAFTVLFSVFILCFFISEFAHAMTQTELEKFWNDNYLGKADKSSFMTLERELLAKASPDETYLRDGESTPIPKVNQSYVWGMVKVGDWIWFGTAANVQCLVLGEYFGITDPQETNDFVCQFGDSPLVSGGLPPQLGDWRPPKIYRYHTQTKILEDMTPAAGDPAQAVAYNLINGCVGIRSAGAVGDTVILAGPALSLAGGVNLFSFSAATGELQWAGVWADYNNIRKWLTNGDQLYAAVGSTVGGAVVRWRGNGVTPETVGILGSSGAELAFFENRIFVNTWPIGALRANFMPEPASLYMSPVVPSGGLTSANQNDWIKVWDANMYEPDPVIATAYGGGAMAVFGDNLYWGTMHVPGLSHVAAVSSYNLPLNTSEDYAKVVLGAWRAVSIFRGNNFVGANLAENAEQKIPASNIELLYGLSHFPVFNTTSGEWEIAPNNMGLPNGIPTMGLAGFGNLFNNYTWSMAVFDDRLFIGTMDFLYPGWSLLEEILSQFTTTKRPALDVPVLPEFFFGADLWRLDAPDALFALPENINGVGNYMNYGVRNMQSDDALYLGMANPMNLSTDTTDEKPEGGWELIRLFQDTDKDGYSDQDEMRYDSDKTNPNSIPLGTLNGGVTVSSYQGDLMVRTLLESDSECPENPLFDFDLGLIQFEVSGITPGATVNVTLEFTEPLVTGTRFFKCDPAMSQGNPWPEITPLVTFEPNSYVAHLSITDNEFPDTNPAAGVIGDPIGVILGKAAPIPTIGSWGIIGLGAFLSLLAALMIHRKRNSRETQS